MNTSEIGRKIYSFLVAAYRWYLRTPIRSLEEAYQAALQIKAIEDQYFNGKKINYDLSTYSSTVMDYFDTDLNKLLKTVRMRLTEFRASRFFLNESSQKDAKKFGIEYPDLSFILEKLRFIDEIVSKYNTYYEVATPQDVVINSSNVPNQVDVQREENIISNRGGGKTDSTGVLPRSIFNTFRRLQVELNPRAEEKVVENFRQSRLQTIRSVRFILLIIIVPILANQLSKNLVVGPIVDHFRQPEQAAIFLNVEMEEEALQEMETFEERVRFESLIGKINPLSQEEMESQMEDKVKEIAEEYRDESSNAVKNVFADILSVIAFICLLLFSKREIAILKSFFDNVVYGLSDSAKAFVIILFTDMFVGFHSPHGWEVILESISRHWGLPSSKSFIFLFIATFPVILDTIFKYWIFRYLNRISPSAVATYHGMNE